MLTSCSIFCLGPFLPVCLAAPLSEPPEFSVDPEECHDLREVFSTQCFLFLSVIYAPSPNWTRRLWRGMMETGLIPLHPFFLGAGFFFKQKQNGSLLPCIDCQSLNEITMKNKHPLPLLDTAFDPLHKTQFSSKLDLRNANHFIWTW